MRSLLWIGVTLCIIVGCSFQRADTAADAQRAMIGLSAEQVLACMGAPAQRMAEGSIEVWAYPSGGADISTGSAYSYATGTGLYAGYGSTGTYTGSGNATTIGSSSTRHRYCVVNVTMNGGIVRSVNYSGNTGGWATQGEQCAYAVQNCTNSLNSAPVTTAPVLPAASLSSSLTDGQIDQHFTEMIVMSCINEAVLGDTAGALAANCRCSAEEVTRAAFADAKREMVLTNNRARRPLDQTIYDETVAIAGIRLHCPDAYGKFLTLGMKGG